MKGLVMKMLDWLVARGWLDRWRGRGGWLGRVVVRADRRWLKAEATKIGVKAKP